MEPDNFDTTCLTYSGFTPADVTYSSDNFHKLYELAEKLIELGKAYVCHCSKLKKMKILTRFRSVHTHRYSLLADEAEIKLQRGGEARGPRYRCNHSEQDVDTNLQKFRDMRDGKYEPQTAFLRMKQDIDNPNPQVHFTFTYLILSLLMIFLTGRCGT